VTETIVSPPGVTIRRADRPGDLGWVVMVHGEQYADELGWDSTFEALVARVVADYGAAHDPVREAAWVAELDGVRAGCVFCVAGDETTAKLRILLVTPAARGRGVGAALVRTCVEFARNSGYRGMTLWTNDVLSSARRIYEAAGFELVDSEPHHSFGHDLVGQHWSLLL
jgi:GNAT superfamily N-acetyltransferase